MRGFFGIVTKGDGTPLFFSINQRREFVASRISYDFDSIKKHMPFI